MGSYAPSMSILRASLGPLAPSTRPSRAGSLGPLAILSGLAAALAAGCDDAPAMGDPDAGTGVRAVFELGPDPLDFGAVPFPDDLYLQGGHVELGAFPREELGDPATIESLRASLREVDGFGVTTPVWFGVDGAIDPASLPATPSATLAEGASALLVDADSASPRAFERVPVRVRWDAETQRISLQPADGHPLREGTRYAAVLTSGVRAADGSPLLPAPAFAAIRDAAARPSDPLAAEAYEQYAPVIASLPARVGVAREEIVALAVFRVQTVGRDLADARALLRARAAPALDVRRVVGAGPDLDALLGIPSADVPGTDVEGGVRHGSIAWVIDGTFRTPELASPAAGRHGRWMRDASGALVVKREDDVWLTLVLPEGVDLAGVPLVVFQHGLGGQRGDVFAVADALCASGFAVASIDIPYHGMRTSGEAIDRVHQYGDATGGDLYGDLGGLTVYADYLGIADEAGELVSFHPFYVRDVLRQSVLDLMALVRTLEAGDLSEIEAMGGPAGVAIDPGEIGFVGISLGGIVGTTFVANEPRVGAALLSVTGGHLARLVEMSASFATTFLGILLPRVGWEYAQIDWDAHPASSLPGVAIFQTLLDRGDSIAHADALARSDVRLLMHMADEDETVPNVATEALARAAGVPMVDGDPVFTDLATATLPVSRNVAVGGEGVTRALVVWDPATHGMLMSRAGAHAWQHPPRPPFVRREPAAPVANPIDGAQAQMQHFFETWREGNAEIVAP